MSRDAGAGTRAHGSESTWQRGPGRGKARRLRVLRNLLDTGLCGPALQGPPGPQASGYHGNSGPPAQRDTLTFPPPPTQRFWLFGAARGTGHRGASEAAPRPSADGLVDLRRGLRASP